MSNKLKLLEVAVKKMSKDKNFMSFILDRYMELENITKDDLISKLHCSLHDFYKLALCKVPYTREKDFKERIKDISEYCSMLDFELSEIIKRVEGIYLCDRCRIHEAEEDSVFCNLCRNNN